ncbi:choloylglycine hydrolase [Paenibacillus sp. DS2015]|uniref:linear amide C-N hydrolase n=1 Tax=Paenibacillus sp. DS2015 TaxID=3373917 RepID=UPI003D19FF52
MSTALHIRQPEVNIVCKNQDVVYDGVYLFTNQRGIAKTALMMPPAKPATWISTYGSLTISQIGKENPNGGINEAGLVVEQTTLWQTEYPAPDERSVLSELAWIQFLLDTCSTVQEALEATSKIRIDQSTSKLHYLVADRSGDRAIVEFLKGEMIVHRDNVPVPIIANTAYADAVQELETGHRDGSHRDEYERNSMERFLVVAETLQARLDEGEAPNVDFAFEVLASAQRKDTVFSLVYNIDLMEIYAVTVRNQERVTIHIADFDFTKETPAQAVDLQSLHAGHVRDQFETYSAAFNHNAVMSFFRDPVLTSIFKWEISEEMIHYLAHYPS